MLNVWLITCIDENDTLQELTFCFESWDAFRQTQRIGQLSDMGTLCRSFGICFRLSWLNCVLYTFRKKSQKPFFCSLSLSIFLHIYHCTQMTQILLYYWWWVLPIDLKVSQVTNFPAISLCRRGLRVKVWLTDC